MQAEFSEEIFTLCKAEGINTCLDTSGCVLNDKVKALLSVTDRVLLDIKYTDDSLYNRYAGCSLYTVLGFLSYLNECNIPVTLRQVIIPTLNDTLENISALKDIAARFPCADKIELLPFRKLCMEKYERLGIDFPFASIPEPDEEKMALLRKETEN